MPIGNLGHNPNVNNSIPPAPPLPSQTDGAGGVVSSLTLRGRWDLVRYLRL